MPVRRIKASGDTTDTVMVATLTATLQRLSDGDFGLIQGDLKHMRCCTGACQKRFSTLSNKRWSLFKRCEFGGRFSLLSNSARGPHTGCPAPPAQCPALPHLCRPAAEPGAAHTPDSSGKPPARTSLPPAGPGSRPKGGGDPGRGPVPAPGEEPPHPGPMRFASLPPRSSVRPWPRPRHVRGRGARRSLRLLAAAVPPLESRVPASRPPPGPQYAFAALGLLAMPGTCGRLSSLLPRLAAALLLLLLLLMGRPPPVDAAAAATRAQQQRAALPGGASAAASGTDPPTDTPPPAFPGEISPLSSPRPRRQGPLSPAASPSSRGEGSASPQLLPPGCRGGPGASVWPVSRVLCCRARDRRRPRAEPEPPGL